MLIVFLAKAIIPSRAVEDNITRTDISGNNKTTLLNRKAGEDMERRGGAWGPLPEWVNILTLPFTANKGEGVQDLYLDYLPPPRAAPLDSPQRVGKFPPAEIHN